MKPHLKQTWCLGQLDSRFIAQMEQILWLYAQPYDPAYPVVCFDERPCFLIGEVVAPLLMRAGHVYKEHYSYEKNGSCALLAAIEPLTGNRLAQVYPQRTKREYTLFCQALATQYPQACKIRLIQDNLNTHNASSFYENLPAAEAFALAQRFEFYYTPKSASWLNMIEIELSALARGCLHQRIPTIEELKRQVLALVAERHEQHIKIDWQFSIETARSKLSRHYDNIRPEPVGVKPSDT
ncbi:IS630 family transposase [Thermoleptolyngbya oregonensis NK1-22]|uniref:IS630 family transposase n=1 Tax=Thermoleptolyngbya oregonensis NK1-22 TaxID=2547457 RepID=A0AA97BAF7_9CYAN|nr:IS630 family transposase [Thermoleptolyngbya oregonensis NK1-22]WOB43241.1 IS630 family transposase [Thermoleptolyngbya oregonensis NK1-22]WOB43658.1 IS630 family transposase [Thermoleptolyngbya oregonensis NK1-22]WOB44380.1 IS630 family transposase [Thermoleptolyngbya oregonensis NK1-22]